MNYLMILGFYAMAISSIGVVITALIYFTQKEKKNALTAFLILVVSPYVGVGISALAIEILEGSNKGIPDNILMILSISPTAILAFLSYKLMQSFETKKAQIEEKKV